MARPKLLLHAVTRSVGEDNEELTFEPGVNLIVGERNSGKSKWLETIDQLLGDDIGAKERTTDDVLLKYDSAALSFSIGEERFAVERHWKQPGLFSKVSVNGNIQSLKDYRELLMQRLEIPIVHFPQGDPYGRRAWPELGWRSLIRHIYRRQKFWTELADRQPESEQHACLMQFLGVATTLFSPDYSALIEQEKTVTTLEAERDQFLRVLNEVTREVVHAKELGIAVNTESVTEALERLEAEQTRIQGAREDVLQRLGRQASPGDDGVVSQLSAALIAVRSEQEITAEALQRTQARMEELGEYRRVLHDELSRMQRAVDAGSVLTDLKITHCPACDQPVDSNAPRPNECYLCKQSIATDVSSDTAGRRVQFEVEQLQAELSETDELLQVLEQDVHKHNAEERA